MHLFQLLGETVRKGFYLYNEKRRSSPDPEIKKYIEKSRSIAGVIPDPKVRSILEIFYS